MKKILYILLGSFTLILGILGILLPILPTTPFLLLTVFFYSKGSNRIHQWFISTKIYQSKIELFAKEKAMYRRDKWILLIFVDIVLIISAIIISNIYVTWFLVVLDLIKYFYFFKYVKTVPNKLNITQIEKNTIAETV